jgi:hypothetical protein
LSSAEQVDGGRPLQKKWMAVVPGRHQLEQFMMFGWQQEMYHCDIMKVECEKREDGKVA